MKSVMASPLEDYKPIWQGSPTFATTHWSVVLAAGSQTTHASQAALDTLCRTYWYPLYAYVRRRGYSRDDAQDLTQGFILRLLDRQYFALAEQRRGKFRTFLLSSLKNFLIDEAEKAKTVRRGGGKSHFSIDADKGEDRYCAGPVTHQTPESHFEEQWAATLIEQALGRLRKEYAEADRQDLFESLKAHLWGDRTSTYARIGETLGMNEGSVKTAAFRLRTRFAETLRAVIADTVSTPNEVEEEIDELITAFGT